VTARVIPREKDNDHLWGVAVEIHRDGEVERFAGQIMGPRETAEIVAKMFVDQTRDPYLLRDSWMPTVSSK